MTIVLLSLLNIFEDSLHFKVGSITILMGFSPDTFLTVSVGLSLKTVFEPTRIACSSLLHL